MIYTMFGTKVEVVDYKPGIQQIKIQYDDGETAWVEILELKADNGLKEISDACQATKNH